MRHGLVIGAVLFVSFSAGGQAELPCAHCPAHRCVTQPSVKTIKKTVYDVKCVPVCEHQPAKFLAPCDCCPVCKLKYNKVLIKREVVTEVCTTICVPVDAGCHTCTQEAPALEPTPAVYGPPIPPPAAVVVE